MSWYSMDVNYVLPHLGCTDPQYEALNITDSIKQVTLMTNPGFVNLESQHSRVSTVSYSAY